VKTTIRIILLILPLVFLQELKAQQLPIYSQYLMNGFMINPAFAGHDGYTSFNATARQQWIGFKDAPQTYSASWQTRLFRRSYKIKPNPFTKNNMLIPSTKGRVGLGAYVVNDRNANVARTGLSFTYAYHIILKDKQLSFGLAIKAFQYRIFTENLTFGEAGDPVINSDLAKVAYSPDADFGVLLHGPKYYTGFSVSNLLETSVRVGANEMPDFKTYRHYWLLGGYDFQVSREVEIESPGGLLGQGLLR
jgi:type IX secretion system PorP/SprF family membrane protein